MPDPTPTPHADPHSPNVGPRSQLGIYRAWLTSPEHRRHITVGRESMLHDTMETLRRNLGKKPKHHQLFIAPRGCGKTHFLSLIEDEIQRDAALAKGYQVVRFPEEANRVCSFADFLLAICEILRPMGEPWQSLHDKLSVELDDDIIATTLTKAIRSHSKKTGQTFILIIENLNQIMEEQIKKSRSIQALRGFLMGDNGCLLIATAPVHFGAHTQPDAPFYDFFDTQVLDVLGPEDTIDLIRRNLEWDKRQDLLEKFSELRPRLLAIHAMTGGNPRLTVMLYELLATESVTAVREQFLMLQDRITPFYQDRMRDLSPQERAVLETIATMRDVPGRPAPRKTPGNIAKLMRMNQPQVSSLINRLTKSLYLIASPNPDDKRSTLYTIREGFFDLWLAMNLSRAFARRIPFISEFFAMFYEQEEARYRKREEYWREMEAGEFKPDAAENLSYLSTIGETHEQAAEKLKLIPALHRAGDAEACIMLKRELRMLSLDSTGRWLGEHADDFHDNPLDEISALIECWQTRREGNLEAFATRLVEMGKSLDYRSWSKLKIEFLRDHIGTLPVSRERIETRLRLADFHTRLARWKEGEEQYTIALSEAEKAGDALLVTAALNNFAQLLQETNEFARAEPMLRRALQYWESAGPSNKHNLAAGLGNLGLLLMDTNRYEEAEPYLRRALKIEEETLGTEHSNVAIVLNNLAQLLIKQHKIEEAMSVMKRAYRIDKDIMGDNHPKIAIHLNNMSSLFLKLDRHGDAKEMMETACRILQKFKEANGVTRRNNHG